MGKPSKKPRTKAKADVLNYTAPVMGLPEISDPSNRPSVRVSAHFIEHKMIRYEEEKKDAQLSFFNSIVSDEIREKVIVQGIATRTIRLTVPETRLMNALLALVKEKSKTKDPESPLYYAGNASPNEHFKWRGKTISPPMLSLKPIELYKAYLRKDDVSGKNIIEINKILDSLRARQFLISPRVKYKGPSGNNLNDIFEEVLPLIRIRRGFRGLTDEEVQRLDDGDKKIREEKEEWTIWINPITVLDITGKWAEIPVDIDARLIKAVGGHHRRVGNETYLLYDRLIHAKSAGRRKVEINSDQLPIVLGLKSEVESGRRRRVVEKVMNAIQAMKKEGILLEHFVAEGAEGQLKDVFMINPDYYK